MYAQLYFMFFYRHGDHRDLHVLTHSFPTRRSSDLLKPAEMHRTQLAATAIDRVAPNRDAVVGEVAAYGGADLLCYRRSEEHTSELQSLMRISYAVLCLEKKAQQISTIQT